MVRGAIPVVLTPPGRTLTKEQEQMLELTSYGLTGLVAMLVVAFCFAFSDELAPRKEESSFDPIQNVHLPGSSVPNETLAAAGSRDRAQQG